MNEGKVVAQGEIKEDDDWTYIFKELPKYDEQGEEIQYQVEEVYSEGENLEYYRIVN